MKATTRLLLLILIALPTVVFAQQMPMQMPQPGGYGTGPISSGYADLLAGLTYTDNALLTQRPNRSDGIGILGLNLDYARQGRLRVSLLGDIDRLEYIRHSFGGSFYGQFNGSALWGAPTDPVQWMLSDSFGEGMTDPLAAPTPTNLQTINYVTTGPFLNLNFGLTNRLTVYGEYGRSTYQRSPYDAQTYEGGAQITHQLSGATSISLQASDARTEYLDTAALINVPGRGSRYNVKQASVQFQGQYVRTNVSLAAGYNTINYGGQKHGAPYYSVQLSRSISPFSTVYIGGQIFYSTLGGAMQSPTAQLNLQGGGGMGIGLVTALPFEQRRATAGWNFHRARTTFHLGGSYSEGLYTAQSSDNHRDATVDIRIGRKLRPTVSLGLQAYGIYTDYSLVHARTHRLTASLTLSKQLARTSIALYILRMQQTGSPGASGFAAASYHDDEIGVYVTYDFAGQRTPGGPASGVPGLPLGY